MSEPLVALWVGSHGTSGTSLYLVAVDLDGEKFLTFNGNGDIWVHSHDYYPVFGEYVKNGNWRLVDKL